MPVTVPIVRDTVLRVRDVRESDAVIYKIQDLSTTVPGTDQSFLLVNHQGTTPYDTKYLNTGMLTWHILGVGPGDVAWDLESARGKFRLDGTPDPIHGYDSLEVSFLHNGLAADFFDGTPDSFNCNSNPNTNLYEEPAYNRPQSVPTFAAFENIHAANDGTGDMFVDVYLSPKQLVTFPNGGEQLQRNVQTNIQWAVRPCARADSISIFLSVDSGTSYALLQANEPNDGAFPWTPVIAGSHFRVRIVSLDKQTGLSGTDDSDADFSVPAGGASCPVVYRGEPGGTMPVNNVLSRSFQFKENGAARTTDLVLLPESAPGQDGRYHFELHEDETYYSAFVTVLSAPS